MPNAGSPASIAMTIMTPRGCVRGQWRPSSMTRAAAVLLPDENGSLAGPSGFSVDLAGRLQRSGISVLQVRRCAEDFDERRLGLLSALDALSRQGVERMALIGWHGGATMAIAAGGMHSAVTGVAALAPEADAAAFVADLAPRSLLIMHGSRDRVTPASASQAVYDRAGDPKRRILYQGERHDFGKRRDEALDTLTAWTRDLLRCPFKPRARLLAPVVDDAPVAIDSENSLMAPSMK